VSEAQDYATHIVDLLESFGCCEARRMFGGCGIFHQGLMFGLIVGDNFYLKADAESRERFLDAGCNAFSYTKKDKEYRVSYFLAPDEFFEDEEARLHWARRGFDSALRNPARKKKNRKS
jgi:DNA transformation protein